MKISIDNSYICSYCKIDHHNLCAELNKNLNGICHCKCIEERKDAAKLSISHIKNKHAS